MKLLEIENTPYDDEDIAIIKVLAQKEAELEVDKMELSGHDKLVALEMMYVTILREKYNITLYN